jgi:lysophospholipase
MSVVRVPGNPEPENAEILWLEGRGGVRLRALFAQAAGPARGSVILCNGRTECIEKYFEVIRELQGRGFCVFTMDWRGQGLSGRTLKNPQKGHLDSFDDPVNDLAQGVKQLGDRLPRPHLVLAHSMGGTIALRALQTRRIEVEAAVFSSPMWGIARLKPSARKLAGFLTALGFGHNFAPGQPHKWRKENFKRNPVTHDRERHARAQALVLAEPDLALAGVTLGWVNAASIAMTGFQQPSALAHLRCPVLVFSAGEDVIVDNEAQAEVAKTLINARVLPIAGAKHEILMELDEYRAQLWRAFDDFADRVAAVSASAPTS